MSRPSAGLITFGDEREDMWVKVFQNMTEPRHDEGVAYLKTLPVDLFSNSSVARTREQINSQVDGLKKHNVDVLIVHIPCWTSPNLVVHGIQRLNKPVVLITSKSAATHGMVGFLGAGGTLQQIGKKHLRIRENFNTDAMTEKLLPYLRAASAVSLLEGEVFGFFGGRSLGIDTGSFDPMQWRKMFKVDVEHIDQLEIIRRAETIDDTRTLAMREWLEEKTKKVLYDEKALTKDKLSYQIRCYLATRDIIEEKNLGFVSVKCMPDLSSHYIPQCLSAAFLPAPFDADGEKKPVSMSCEADGDGALTMEMLKHISGGNPPMFADLSHLDHDDNVLYLPNCGAMCAWFAGRSEIPEENMKNIEIRPSVRPAGGSSTYFSAAPGSMTLARLYRWDGEYRMAIIPGHAIELSKEKQVAFIEARGPHQLPTAFVKVSANLDDIIQEFGSNHISGVAGDYVEELVQLCHMTGITPMVFK
jgi:L-fucose isomerase